MTKYFTYLANWRDYSKVVWSYPYLDFTGLGSLTTASMPVFDRSIKNHPVFIGVVGLDLQIDLVLEYANTTDIDEVMKRLINNSKCPTLNVSYCRLEEIRGSSRCFSKNLCDNHIISNNCARIFKDSVLCGNKLYNGMSFYPCWQTKLH